MKYLSLCIPTNGIAEWVFPVLDNIYTQNVDEKLFEVVVTDNGQNFQFHEKMLEYVKKHENLIYKKNNAFLFENQIEALRLANGEFLKFINHRSIFEPGALQWMIEIVKENIHDKPVIYLSNGVLHLKERKVSDFDGFVRGLKQYASWTTGVGVWKVDFQKIPENKVYNRISPHSDVLFSERNKKKYIIDDRTWSHDIGANHSKKGTYDLYKAFGCEEIAITLQLFMDGDISADTLKYIIKCYEKCVANFYLEFNIMKQPCSYKLDKFDEIMGIFISKRKVLFKAYCNIPRYILSKLFFEIRNHFKKVKEEVPCSKR